MWHTMRCLPLSMLRARPISAALKWSMVPVIACLPWQLQCRMLSGRACEKAVAEALKSAKPSPTEYTTKAPRGKPKRTGSADILKALFRVEPTARAVAEVLKSAIPNQYFEIITRLGGQRDSRRAVLVLNAIPEKERYVYHYNSTISACGKSGRWEVALRLFHSMPEAGVERDVYTYNAAINACGQVGQWQEALRLLRSMPEAGVERDVRTYNAAINACEKGCQWEEALRLFHSMPEAGVERDVYTYNAAINACGQVGQWQEALRLLRSMPEAGVERDVRTYNAAINACEKGCQWEEALRLFHSMSEASVERNASTYNAAISACVSGAQWKNLRKRQFAPTTTGLSDLTIGFAERANDGDEIVDQADIAMQLFKDALQQKLFVAPHLSANQWLLKLRHESEGAAETAVRWWLQEEVKPWLCSDLGRSSAVDMQVGFIIGRSAQARVKSVLGELQVPLKEDKRPGRLLIDCGRWLEQNTQINDPRDASGNHH